MTRTIRRISASLSCDISCNELVLYQSTVHLVTAGVSIEQFAESRAQRTLLQRFSIRAVVMEGGEIGIGVRMMGRLCVPIAWRSAWEAA
jgi:hypothetical protein